MSSNPRVSRSPTRIQKIAAQRNNHAEDSDKKFECLADEGTNAYLKEKIKAIEAERGKQ